MQHCWLDDIPEPSSKNEHYNISHFWHHTVQYCRTNTRLPRCVHPCSLHTAQPYGASMSRVPWAFHFAEHRNGAATPSMSVLLFCTCVPDALWQSIAAFCPVPIYTAWWQRHMCVNNLSRVVIMKRALNVIRNTSAKKLNRHARYSCSITMFSEAERSQHPWQVVHTHVPLSPSSINWYWTKRGDAPWQSIAAFCPVPIYTAWLCGWEGNRRSGITLAMRQWYFTKGRWAPCLWRPAVRHHFCLFIRIVIFYH